MDLRVADGHLRVSRSGDGRTHTYKIVRSVPFQGDDGVGDLILGIAGDVKAVKIPLSGLDTDPLGFLIAELSSLKGRQDGATLHNSSVIQDDGGMEIAHCLLSKPEGRAGDVI